MKNKNLNKRLLNVERSIAIYKRNVSDSPSEEIKINIDIDVLKTIVSVKDDDPLIYDGYVLNKEQLTKINQYVNNKIVPNFEVYTYILEATGIYDW